MCHVMLSQIWELLFDCFLSRANARLNCSDGTNCIHLLRLCDVTPGETLTEICIFFSCEAFRCSNTVYFWHIYSRKEVIGYFDDELGSADKLICLFCFIVSEVTNSKSAAHAQHLSLQRKKYLEHRNNTKFYLLYVQSYNIIGWA